MSNTCICKNTQREIKCGVCAKKEVQTCDTFDNEMRCKVHKKMIICGFRPDLCQQCIDDGYVAEGGHGGPDKIENTKTGITLDEKHIKY